MEQVVENNQEADKSPRSASLALLLCIFLGFLGIHRFYVGKILTGILMLITAGGLGIWVLVDIILLSICAFKDKNGKVLIFQKYPGSAALYVWKVLGIILVVLIIYIGFVVMLALYATSGIADAARKELLAIKNKNYAEAYSSTSKAFQQTESIDSFKNFVKSHPSLLNYKKVTFYKRVIENDQGLLLGTLTSQDGSKTTIKIILIKEKGEWKIFSILLDEPLLQNKVSGTPTEKNKSENSQMQLSKKYTDTNHLYTINYPENWEYHVVSDKTVIFNGLKESAYYYNTINIQVVPAHDNAGMYKNTNDFVQDIKNQLADKVSNLKVIDQGDTSIQQGNGKFHGKYVVFTYEHQGQKMKQKLVIIYDNDNQHYYSWAYATFADQFDKGLPIMKAMFHAWKFEQRTN